MIEFRRYTSRAKEFCEPQLFTLEYLTLGLVEESGEVAGKVKRILRGDYEQFPVQEVTNELGDVLWNYALLLDFLGIPLEAVMEKKLTKLNERKQNNKIKGTGDER